MTLGAYFGLLGAAIALALVPGPDTLLTLRYALRGRRAGVLVALGATTSMLIWGLLAAVGVVAVLSASVIAYDLLTIAGGAYIVYLGVRLVIGGAAVLLGRGPSVARAAVGAPSERSGGENDASGRRWVERAGPYLAGLLSCITNPKVGIFFLALFPEFVPEGATWWFVAGVLGGTCAAAGLVYLLVVALVADAMNRWLARPRVTAIIEGLSGLVLAVLGLLVLVPGIIGLATGTRA